MIKAKDLNMIYKRLAELLVKKGQPVDNTIELTNVQFILENIDNHLISIENSREVSYKYLLAENIWYASGSNKLKYIGQYANKWNSISDDGETSNSAYGYIIRSKFGFNQIFKMIDLLRKSPTSRRACIVLNDANPDVDSTKDEQCTMYLQFMIRNGKLNCTANMRSNDIYYGLPNDVPAFIAIQKIIAYYLNIECGTYTHYAGSLHVYQQNFDKIKNAINGKINKPKYYINFIELYLQCFDEDNLLFRHALNYPDKLVDCCRKMRILNEFR